MEFYDAGSSDLRELWESYLVEPTSSHDVLSMTKDDDWCHLLNTRDKSLGVVLRDKLMTDAALGGPRPIKSEHSYSLLTCSPPVSPATLGSNPHTPNPGPMTIHNNDQYHKVTLEGHKVVTFRTKIDDMEEECFPAISMDTASGRSSSPSSQSALTNLLTESLISSNKREIIKDPVRLEIKGESMSGRNSLLESCVAPNLPYNKSTIAISSPHRLHFCGSHGANTSDSEEDDEEYYQSMELEIETASMRTENYRGARQSLPPTPPSSASSDSEGTASASCSPERRDSQNCHVHNLRGFLGTRLYVKAGHSTRQPIHTTLISCQPKGSTGCLILTEEEKRTLVAEGYPVPTKLPLTKQEEKSLKKVRRKIKNKISAQESRRKKKEYMDGLEKRVTMLTNENSSYRDRLTSLENANQQLIKELEHLQTLLERQSS